MLDWKNGIGRDLRNVLWSEEEIQSKVAEIGEEIAKDYADRRVLMVGILNGCVPFMADLLRAINAHVEMDFMSVSSYSGGTQSTGVVRILKDLNASIDGRHVLLVEDIIDTGLTGRYLLENLMTRHPASMEVCALLDKREARPEEVAIKYTGFVCPNEFVVGYGLDYDGLYRNLPYIGVLKEEVYAS
jgi:hypoxanthine phosphoribosyltransferase